MQEQYERLYLTATTGAENNDFITVEAVQGFIKLIEENESPETGWPLADRLIKVLAGKKEMSNPAQSDAQISGPTMNGLEMRRWFDCVFLFLGFMKRVNPTLIEETFFIDAKDPIHYLGLLKAGLDSSRSSDYFRTDLFCYLRPSRVMDEGMILNELYKQERDDDRYPELIRAISKMAYMPGMNPKAWNLPDVFKYFSSTLLKAAIYIPKYNMLQALTYMSQADKELEDELLTFIQQSVFYELFQEFKSAGYGPGIALCLILSLLYNAPNQLARDEGGASKTGYDALIRLKRSDNFSEYFNEIQATLIQFGFEKNITIFSKKNLIGIIKAMESQNLTTYYWFLKDKILRNDYGLTAKDVIVNFGDSIMKLERLEETNALNSFISNVLPNIDTDDSKSLSWLNRIAEASPTVRESPQYQKLMEGCH